MYPETILLMGLAFVSAACFVPLVFLLTGKRKDRLASRLEELSASGEADPVAVRAKLVRSTLPKMGAILLPKHAEERTRLQTRLIHAGLYGRQAMLSFLGVKMLLILAPAIIGLIAGLSGVLSIQKGVIYGVLAGVFGMIGPSFWLDRRKTIRQRQFRRALPDALDMVVVCLEGGGTLQSALQRVAAELRNVHSALAMELSIANREVQMGNSVGGALKHLADRTDIEELRSLATVIQQSDLYGASLVKALRVYAESLRLQRLYRAEELGQKAVVKLLFPTALLILPATFIVILGPAVLEIAKMFKNMR